MTTVLLILALLLAFLTGAAFTAAVLTITTATRKPEATR